MKSLALAITVALTPYSASAYDMSRGLVASCEISANIITRIAREHEAGMPGFMVYAMMHNFFGTSVPQKSTRDGMAEAIIMANDEGYPVTLPANLFLESCMDEAGDLF